MTNTVTAARADSPSGPIAALRAGARWLAGRELILVALAAPFLLFPNRWTLPAFGLILLAWLIRAVATGRLTRPTAFDLPLAILLIAAVAGYLLSPDPAMSRAKLWGIVLQVALFYAVANSVRSERAVWRMAGLLLLATVSVALCVAVSGVLLVRSNTFSAILDTSDCVISEPSPAVIRAMHVAPPSSQIAACVTSLAAMRACP